MIVSRFWAGREMPEAYQEYGERWAALNGAHVKTWGMEVLRYMPSPLLRVINDIQYRDDGRNGIEMYVQIADVVGYWLVWTYGGVYVNCDVQPIKPLPDEHKDAWASYENDEDGRIVNAVIGARTPGNKFWTGLLDALPARYFSATMAEMVWTTGPAFLTEFAEANPGMLSVYPRNVFNPVHWKDVPKGGDASGFELPEEAVACHHWGHRRDGRTNYVEVATQ